MAKKAVILKTYEDLLMEYQIVGEMGEHSSSSYSAIACTNGNTQVQS
jgi:hypothetical protein